jgi:hypothetical protein
MFVPSHGVKRLRLQKTRTVAHYTRVHHNTLHRSFTFTVPWLRQGNAASGSAPPTAMGFFFVFCFQSGSSPLLTNLVRNTFTVPSVIHPCTEASDYRFRLLLKYVHHQVLSIYSHHCVFCQHTAIVWYFANIQPSLRILLTYSHHWVFVNRQPSSRISPIYSNHQVFC